MFDGDAVELFEHRLLNEVIGLDDADIFATGHLQAEVHRGAVAAVGLVHNPETRIIGNRFADEGERVVSRSIIQANDFNVVQRLHLEAHETFGDKVGYVVTRNQN